ncbi:MAG: glycosyl transferase group 1 [Frankiales bacterium]|nr:glycosyl transferase group 1 [Frankiales bacterium]
MVNRLSITHLIDGLAVGGAESLEVTFAAEARGRSLSLTVITLNDRRPMPTYAARLQELGAAVRVLNPVPSSRPRRVGGVVRLAKMLRDDRTDVLHTSLMHANILGAAAGRLAGVPVVSSLHGTLDDTGHHRRHVRLLEAAALRWGAKRVIAVGDAVAEEHSARLGGRRIDVVRNAVPPGVRMTRQERARVRLGVGVATTDRLLLTVGRLSPEKGQDHLLSALPTVIGHHPAATLLVVGEGPRLPALQAHAAALGVAGSVRLLGNRDDVPSLLAAADVFVSSSLYEGLPLAVLEAMAAGLPIVATSVGELPSVLGCGRGVLVPPSSPGALATAITELLDRPARMEALARMGPRYICEHHSAEAWVDRLMGIYSEVADGPGSAGP